MKKFCFICSIDSDTFQRRGTSMFIVYLCLSSLLPFSLPYRSDLIFLSRFSFHLDLYFHQKKDHHLWNYLFFFIYLQEKKNSGHLFTFLESFVYHQMMKNQTGFFPVGKSILTLAKSKASQPIAATTTIVATNKTDNEIANILV